MMSVLLSLLCQLQQLATGGITYTVGEAIAQEITVSQGQCMNGKEMQVAMRDEDEAIAPSPSLRKDVIDTGKDVINMQYLSEVLEARS